MIWAPRAVQGEGGKPLEKKSQAAELQFDVDVDKEAKEVIVAPIATPIFRAPSELRMSLITKDSRSVPITVRTISMPNTVPRYAGKLDIWNSSYIGLEIEFRFGKGSPWKKVHHDFEKGARPGER